MIILKLIKILIIIDDFDLFEKKLLQIGLMSINKKLKRFLKQNHKSVSNI